MKHILIRCGLTKTRKIIEQDMATTKKFVEAAKTKIVKEILQQATQMKIVEEEAKQYASEQWNTKDEAKQLVVLRQKNE